MNQSGLVSKSFAGRGWNAGCFLQDNDRIKAQTKTTFSQHGQYKEGLVSIASHKHGSNPCMAA